VEVNEVLHFLFPLFDAYYVKHFVNSIELFHLVNKKVYNVGDCLHSLKGIMMSKVFWFFISALELGWVNCVFCVTLLTVGCDTSSLQVILTGQW
jgi:hypothetical protein